MSELRLDPVLSDGMVIQRDTENLFRGFAPAGAEVSIAAGGKTLSCRADENGRFACTVPPLEACCEPFTVTVTCGSETAEVKDVLVGDVFHITGQSNMELPIIRTFDPFSDVFRKPDSPMIREFRAPIEPCFDPGAELDMFSGGHWIRSDSEEALMMSAAGYFFARTLYEDIRIPIGLVNTSAGGSPIEGRLPYSVLREYPEYDAFLDEATVPGYIENTAKTDAEREGALYRLIEDSDKDRDTVLSGGSPEGETVSFPLFLPDFAGRLWFYKDITLPDNFPTDDVMLILGTMTDRDVAYINGVQVGETGYMYPPRNYRVPAGVLRPGKNRIAFLLDIRYGAGGVTEGKRWCLKSGSHILDLTDGWTMCRSVVTEKIKPSAFFPGLPLAVYGRSTAPVYNLRFKAMLIYQGESNGYNAESYVKMYTRFVEYSRQRFGYDIPVISVQLPEFGFVNDDSWSLVREAQLECCKIPGTAMAVAIGLGEWNDLHPLNEWEVGRRLAVCTKALVYDKKDFEPVTCTSAEYGDGEATLTFSASVMPDETGEGFEAVYPSGAEKVRATGESGGIKLTLPGGKPEQLRYAWAPAPTPHLFDESGLPVSPFRVKFK